MPIEQRHIRTKHSGSSAVCHSVAATGNRLVTDCRGFRARYVLYSLPSHGSSWKLRLRPPLLQLCARPSPRLRQAEHTSCKRSAGGPDSTWLQQGRHWHPSLSLLRIDATRRLPWLASEFCVNIFEDVNTGGRPSWERSSAAFAHDWAQAEPFLGRPRDFCDAHPSLVSPACQDEE